MDNTHHKISHIPIVSPSLPMVVLLHHGELELYLHKRNVSLLRIFNIGSFV